MKMGKNVSMYIQAFRTQMYKVPEMTQEEAFSLFMRGSGTQNPGTDRLPCGRGSGSSDGYGGES